MFFENLHHGYFVVIAFNSEDFKRVNAVHEIVADIRKTTGYNIKTVVIDARFGKPSASRL